MNSVQASNLLTLAYFLKTEVKPANFDMGRWGEKRREVQRIEINAQETPASSCLKHLELGESEEHESPCEYKEVVSCGTSACALGWATTVFPETFRMKWNGDSDYMQGHVYEVGTNTALATDSPVVLKFFGITSSEGYDLFGGEPATPKKKAAQMERLADKYGYTYAD